MLIWLSVSGGHFLPTPIYWTRYFFLLFPHNQLYWCIVKLVVKFGVSIALLESYSYKVKQIFRQSKICYIQTFEWLRMTILNNCH